MYTSARIPAERQTGASVCVEKRAVLWWRVCTGSDWTDVRGMRGLLPLFGFDLTFPWKSPAATDG